MPEHDNEEVSVHYNHSNMSAIEMLIEESEKRATLHGDTTFVFLSAALVFIMTPGLGYFYSGMARSKTALSLIMLCFLTMAVVFIQWILFGASLAFSESGNWFIGDFQYAGGRGVGSKPLSPSVSSIAFFMYQGMFAAITPALIFGSVAERVKFVPCVFFVFIWTTIVYDPVAYWTWGEKGFLFKLGSLDFAGGTPVHICSGFAGLAMTLVVGKRDDFDKEKEYKAHNISNVFLGTALLTFGWIGFNGGSALAGTPRAAMAAMVSLIASAASGLTWVFYEYRHHRKLSGLDFCCGAIAGLAAVTPGSGFVAPWAAIIIGCTNGILANVGCKLKHYIGIDDALDTFGVHGVGGFYGNIVAGIFAQKWIAELDGAKIDGGWVDGNWMQVPYQLAGSFAGAIWSFGWTFVIVNIMQRIPKLRLRLNPEEELLGDMAEMGEGAPHSYPAPKSELDHVAIIKMTDVDKDSDGLSKPKSAYSVKKSAENIKNLYNKTFGRPSSATNLVRPTSATTFVKTTSSPDTGRKTSETKSEDIINQNEVFDKYDNEPVTKSPNNRPLTTTVQNTKVDNLIINNNHDFFGKIESSDNISKLSVFRPNTGNDYTERTFDKPTGNHQIPMQLFDEMKH